MLPDNLQGEIIVSPTGKRFRCRATRRTDDYGQKLYKLEPLFGLPGSKTLWSRDDLQREGAQWDAAGKE